ncbi:MAG: hypothetical protein ACOYJG_05485 [Prevotella sp.]
MYQSTWTKTIGIMLAVAFVTVASAQPPRQKFNPQSMIPTRVVTPVKTKVSINNAQPIERGLYKLTPKKVESQQTELINEDFTKFTNGSEDNPDTINWVANTWKGTNNDISSDLTQKAGWIGNFVAQAGGAAGLRSPGAAYQTSAWIATPPADYSGTVTVTFRAKRWVGYKGNVNIQGYLSDFNGNYYNSEEASPVFRIFGSDEGWQYYTWTFDCYDSNPAYRIALLTYDMVIIDDINVRVSADKFVAEPTMKEITNVTDSGFTINWENVRAANTYLIGLKKKVWTGDEETPSYFFDFEDGTVPDGFGGNVSVEEGIGLNGTKGMTTADTLILPSNNALLKKAELYMGVIGPENASQEDLGVSYIYVAYHKDGKWTSSGFYEARYFLNELVSENLLDGGWYGSLADKYDAIRFTLSDFPEGYKLVIDSVALTTNRAFDYEMINEPGNFYSYGDNYDFDTGEGIIDWHVSSTIDNPTTSYTIKDLDEVFDPYDPSAEYYYAVIARRYKTNSTYTWYHAFCPSAPKATTPTDVDARGSYTANWTKSVKATRYSVTNYGVYIAKEDEENHPLIDEDFSLINSDVTSANDPANPEALGNDYSIMSFDGYTKLPGWSGLCNTVAQGYLGCTAAYYYVPTIVTPKFQADNDNSVTLDILALGTAGDNLVLTLQNGNTYLATFDEDGYIDINTTIEESAKEMQIAFTSQNYQPFMLDEFAVTQNLKAGAQVYTPLETVIVNAPDTSYTFTGLTDEYEYYAYDVMALQDLDGQTAASDPSNRVVLNLSKPDDPIVDGIRDASMNDSNSLAKVITRYGIDGRPVNANTKGIQILKLSSGKTVKTVVR